MLRLAACFIGLLLISDEMLGQEQSSPEAKSPGASKQKVIMGWLESIYLRPWNRRLTAKLDTGAKTSSIHADKIEHFSKGGDDWVRFSLVDIEDRKLPPIVVEKPLLRTALIKSHDNQASKRDVVLMTICKNGQEYEAEFNLVDRSNFNYPVLLGRSFLKDVALVDPSETFLFKGDQDPCRGKGEAER